MKIDTVMDMVKWTKDNINVHNTQLPSDVLDLIGDNNGIENVPDDFLSFALVAYAVREGYYKDGMTAQDKQKLLNDDKSTMYVSRLYLSFVLEKLRRYKVISFDPVNIFNVEQIEDKNIDIIGTQDFIEEELKGKTIPYKEFVNVFW